VEVQKLLQVELRDGKVKSVRRRKRTERARQPAGLLVDKREKDKGWTGQIVQMQTERVQKADGLGGGLAWFVGDRFRSAVDGGRAADGDAALVHAAHGYVDNLREMQTL
jgi:hypothetical protein